MFNRFVTDIKNSFYNPEFYKRVSDIGLSHPFWLFVKLSFISAFVVVAMLVPFAVTFIQDIQDATTGEYFPSELEVVIEEGVATTNLTEEPYFVTSDRFDSEILPNEASNILMIDTREDLTIAEIANEDAFVFVTKTGFAFRDEEEIRFFSYGEVFDEKIVVNEENVSRWVTALVDKLPLVATLMGLFILFFLTFSTPFAWLAITFVFSALTLVINSSRNLGLKYKDVFKMSMYAMVPAIVIDIITDILFGLESFSIFITLAIFAVALIWNTTPRQKTEFP